MWGRRRGRRRRRKRLTIAIANTYTNRNRVIPPFYCTNADRLQVSSCSYGMRASTHPMLVKTAGCTGLGVPDVQG